MFHSPGVVGQHPMAARLERPHNTRVEILHNPLSNMKTIKYVILAVAATALAACDQQKAAVDDQTKATKESIDDRKDAVDTAAKDAKKQTDVDAEVTKANIKAAEESAQAQLDAEKKKVEAAAEAEKARIDAEKP
jgi:hypothetical protein